MKKQRTFFLVVSIMISMTLACAIGYEGLQISDDPEPTDPISEMFAQETFEASMAEDSDQGSQAPAAVEIQATEVPIIGNVSSSDPESTHGEEQEYSVSAVNQGCTCSVEGNNQVIELKFNGDQLEYQGVLFDKIAENIYKRSYMGYYILVSGEGENKTSTQVDEEQHNVIILSKDGFVLENYQGEESSPCCYYTYTAEK